MPRISNFNNGSKSELESLSIVPLNGEIYSCKNCNTVIDADYNAAINIHNLRKNMDVYKLKVQQKLIA